MTGINIGAFLAAIAMMENGPTATHHSVYCLSDAAIQDVNEREGTHYTAANVNADSYNARGCAAWYAGILAQRLETQLARPPTVPELAAAWRGGHRGWRSHVRGYGARAANLYERFLDDAD